MGRGRLLEKKNPFINCLYFLTVCSIVPTVRYICFSRTLWELGEVLKATMARPLTKPENLANAS